MKRSLLKLELIATLFLIPACNAAAPKVLEDPVIPGGLTGHASPVGKSVHALSTPSTSNPTSANAGECAGWTTDVERYDPATGDFEYQYSCAQGGELSQIRTTGHDDSAGNGTYQTVYTHRDASTVTWSYTYALGGDGVTENYHGTSTEGESYDGTQRTDANMSTEVHEVWHLSSGVYHDDGTYDVNMLFNGTESFDDPSTPDSPDWSMVQTQTSTSFQQIVDSAGGGWTSHYVYAVHGDSSADYSFETDDGSTSSQPDYAGSYHYNSDGSGQGSYRQLFDGGSQLAVSDTFTAQGADHETWTFDDSATSIAPDQDGAIDFAPDGSGTGTVTTHVQGGASRTCDVAIGTGGSTTISNCR